MSELKALDALREWSHRYDNKWLQPDGTAYVIANNHGVYVGENYGEYVRSMLDAVEAELSERYMELPVDAGGEVIKPGDTLEYVDVENRKAIIGTVERICLDNGEVTIRFGNRPNAVFARESWKFLHVKPRTIEDVLLDAGVSRACVEDVAAEIRELMGGGE